MQNTAIADIKVNLLVRGAERELVLNLLRLLQRKKMVEFQIEDDIEIKKPGFTDWTAKQINAMIEKAEKEESIPFEEFRTKYGL